MPKAIPRGPLFRLDGIEPDVDLAWHLAGPAGHRAFYREAMAIGLAVKDKSLARGLDIMGRVMQISEKTRRNRRSAMGDAYYRAPALTPAFEASRTRSYLRAEADAAGVTFWWRHDPRTKGSWGTILLYQRAAGRNVVGLSASDLDKIYAHMKRWWAANRTRLALRGAVRGEVIGAGSPFRIPSIVAAPPPARPARPAPTIDLSRATFGEGGRDALERLLGGRNVVVDRGTSQRRGRLVKR